MKKIIALIIIGLFMCLPIATSAEIVKEEDYEEQDTGATIAINARSYEPTILTSNLLEDNSVPVYVYLAGGTIGSLIPSSYNVEPVYGGLEIEKMRVKALDSNTNDLIEGDPDFQKPNKVDVDTLGYLIVTLKQFETDNFEICASNADCDDGYMCETGACYPAEINLSFTAEIWFKQTERLYSLSKSALMLGESSDEDAWIESLNSYSSMYSFYGGRGLVRVRDIDDNTVYLTVYSNKDLYWPIIEAPRPIADIVLDKGETSEYIDLGYTDEQVMQNAMFRITLNDLRDPLKDRATVAVTVDGSRNTNVVSEGSALYPGSVWTVTDISKVQGRDGWEFSLKLKNSKGNTKTLTTVVDSGLDEGESAVLAKKFVDESNSTKDGIYFTTNNKIINEVPVSQLTQFFQAFRGAPSIKVNAVEGDVTNLNKFTITAGMSVRDVLISVLPSGYYFEVNDKGEIEINSYSVTDPCKEIEIYTYEDVNSFQLVKQDDTGSFGFDSSVTKSNRVKVDLLCSSINQYQSIINNYDSEILLVEKQTSIVDEAYLGKAEAYKALAGIDLLTAEEKRGSKNEAYLAYKYLVDKESKINAGIQSAYSDLQKELFGNANYGAESLDDNGREIYVELLAITELSKEEMPSATISIDGVDKVYSLNDPIFAYEQTDGKTTFNWYVYKISDSGVTLRKVSGGSVKDTETVKVDEKMTIGNYVISVESVNSKKVAYLTITPGSGDALRSTSNFSIHIPIERRAIQLNPEKIDDKIEKARKLQETLDGLTEKLNKIVKTWNYVCLGVMAFVTVKTGLSGSVAKVRSNVIHGADGTSGWHEYCIRMSSGTYSEKPYKTYDECMQSNAETIQEDIELAIEAKTYSESNFEDDQWYKDMINTYGAENLKECQKLLGEDIFLDSETMKQYAYLEYLKQNEQSDVVEPFLDSVKTTQNVILSTEQMKTKTNSCDAALSSVKNSESEYEKLEGDELEAKKKQIALGAYENTEKTYTNEIPETKDSFDTLTKNLIGISIQNVGKIFMDNKGNKKVYTAKGTDTVTELDYQDYLTLLRAATKEKCNENFSPKKDLDKDACVEIEKDIKTLTGSTGVTDLARANTDIVAKSGAQFFINNDNTKIYVGLPAYSTGSINEEFADGAKLEMFCSGEFQGLPYCLPHKNGNFIKFDEKEGYTKANEINIFDYYNVGPDGQLCTDDDVLVAHRSELHFNTANPSYQELKTFANTFVKKKLVEKQTISIGSKKDFVVSCTKSKVALGQAEGNCYDVMGVSDCKLLFNTCDPVMCPPSRFNLNGKWQVDNVVESGIIGSVVLGLGNGDMVPFCLTGILSNLKYLNSMLDGYVECLEAAKFEGKSVGICDKVRNVYVCEIITREVASILDAGNGGLLDFLASKLFGREEQGGGEYLKFKEAIGRMEDSVSYLTTDYATTAFAAFRGRTLDEVGSEICKQAIYANTPWFEDLMTQLTTPEDPTQFYASLNSRTYAPSQGTVAYATYYHIYAGTNANIERVVYTVYLKNSLTNERYEVTDECGGASATLELGGMVDKNIDCLAAEGFDTVCVVLNGETQCGFGTVTTAFSMDYFKDSLLASEAQRNITTEEQCYPSATEQSSTINSLASLGLTDSYSLGAFSNGVQRVCAINNPGLGQGSSSNWVVIGSCGKDDEGRTLGDCWINKDSVNVKNAEKAEEVNDFFKKTMFDKQKEAWGITELYTAEQTIEYYTKYIETYKTNKKCSDYIKLLDLFRELNMRTTSYDYAASAEYYIGKVFFSLATENSICGVTGRTEIDYEGFVNGESIGSLRQIKLDNDANVKFVVKFENMDPNDKIIPGTPSNKAKIDCEGDTCEFMIDMNERNGLDYISVPITIEDSNGEVIFSSDFKFTLEAPENLFVSSGEVCGQCGAGATNFCDLDECHGSGMSGCYFDDGYVLDSCMACKDLKTFVFDEGSSMAEARCNKLSDDKSRCESDDCYDEFLKNDGYSGKCDWDDEDKCVYVVSKTNLSSRTVSSSACQATEGTIYERALLDAIASTEGVSYNRLYSSKYFNFTKCNEGHPYYWTIDNPYGFPLPPLTKDYLGAGRYQFIPNTYKSAWRSADLGNDFCAESQDKAALYIINNEKGISSEDIKNAYGSDNWASVLDPISKTWYGIPNSQKGRSWYSGGHAQSQTYVISVFKSCLEKYESE